MFEVTTGIKKLISVRKDSRRIKEIPGGTWAGKTYDIIAILIDDAARLINEDITVVGETIPAVKSGPLKDFKKIMTQTNRWNAKNYNATNRIYTFSSGSSIEFAAYPDEDSAKQAGKRDKLFVNEINTIPQPIVDALIIRTNSDIWVDYNPTASFWFNQEYSNTNNCITERLTYRDNEALPDSILSELESRREKAKTSSYWNNWCKVYLDGETGSLEGVCIPDWKELEILPNEARLLCHGLDFGYTNDPTSLVSLYKWNNAYIFDEVIYQKKLLNSDISDLLKANEITGIIYADSAEPKSIAELSHYRHQVMSVSKGRDSIVYGINLINQNEIYVTARSKNLIKELSNYIWMKDREGNTLNKPIDAFNHAIDAARYAITSQLENPNRGKYFVY